MKARKRIKKFFKAIVILFLVGFLGLYIFAMMVALVTSVPFVRIIPHDNVFEEIYYDKTWGWYMHKQVSSFQEDNRLYWFHVMPTFSPWTSTRNGVKMCRTYLEDDSRTEILYYKEAKRIDFVWEKRVEPDSITEEYDYYIMIYSYDMKSKILSYGGNVTETDETNALKRVLQEWFTYNGEDSKYSMDNLGDYTDAGRTFPKEEWTKYFSHEYVGEWNPASP